jgi:tetratricopeptide (TPR) repeat protein
MKSERQQNQESDLIADKIESYLVKVKKALPQILVLLGIVVVGLLGWGIYYSMHSTKLAKAWTALYFSDTTAADLDSIADDFSGTQASSWALQIAGDSHLAKGSEAVFSNRELADKHYQNAMDEYKKVVAKSPEGLLAARAHWGLAQAQEGLGMREEAASTYKKVSRLADAEPTIQQEATKRAAWLESTDGESFYVWFKENRSKPVAPLSGLPGELPPVPGSPTFNLDDFNKSPLPPGPTEQEAVAVPVEPKLPEFPNPIPDKPQ